jgi:hypothetical protein
MFLVRSVASTHFLTMLREEGQGILDSLDREVELLQDFTRKTRDGLGHWRHQTPLNAAGPIRRVLGLAHTGGGEALCFMTRFFWHRTTC